ncbi:MAG: DNA-3-methyladenine glycosylase family protein [Cyclobacteriaceae bacterium]
MENQQKAKKHLIQSDVVLANIMREVGDIDLSRRLELSTKNHFGTLVFGIIGQRNPERVTIKILADLKTKFQNESPTVEDILATPKAELEQLTNSYKKADYLLHLAHAVKSGLLQLNKIETFTDEKIIEQLTSVKGIGSWTAEQFLFWHLERPDVLGKGDPAIKKAVMRIYQLKALLTEEELETISKPWRPYRTLACHYLLRSKYGPGVSSGWPSQMPRPLQY